MAGKGRAPASKTAARPAQKTNGRHQDARADHTDTVAGAEEEEELDPIDESETTPTKNRLGTKSSDDHLRTPTIVTKRSTEMLADLDLDSEDEEEDDSVGETKEGAIRRKMAELTASGWRPTEELGKDDEEDDDEDYSALDLISQSDEDERTIRRQELMSFNEPSMSVTKQEFLARKLSLSSTASDDLEWNGFDDVDFLSSSNTPQPGRLLDFDESRPPAFLLADESRSAFPRSPKIVPENRKVRFQDETAASDEDSSDSDDEDFPDLFLDPIPLVGFEAVNIDDYADDYSDGASTVYDFDGDEMDVDEDDSDNDVYSSDEDGSSSGYESDGGETTDEDDLDTMIRPLSNDEQKGTKSGTPTGLATPAKAVAATPVKAKGKKRTPKSEPSRPSTALSVDREPPSGTFDLDPARPVLIVSGSGFAQRNTIYPPNKIQTPDEKKHWQRLHQTYAKRTSFPQTSVQMTAEAEMDMSASNAIQASFDFAGPLNPDDVLGPSEAFLPFTSVDSSGIVTEDQSMHSDTEEDEYNLEFISPFLNLDAMTDDTDEGEDSTQETPDGKTLSRQRSQTLPSMSGSMTPTPSLRRGSTMESDAADTLLSHLSRSKHLVNSFRMNQHYAKEVAARPAHPSLRASTSEINAMQTGRRKAGNTPITPLRKRRGGSISKVSKVDFGKGTTSSGLKDVAGFLKRPSSAGRGSMGRPHVRSGLFR